jgi:hypothetical protein
MLLYLRLGFAVTAFFLSQRTWGDGPNLTKIRVCVGPLRRFLHSRVYLSPVGRAPTSRGRPAQILVGSAQRAGLAAQQAGLAAHGAH